MRALVTGATGFIGARLAEKLAADGHEVIAFGAENTPIETARRSRLEEQGIRIEIGRLEDAALLARLAGEADTIFHLAAAQHESNVPDEYFRSVNVGGTRKLVEAANSAGVSRFVYGSTIGVYGRAVNGRLDESSETRPENVYGRTKLEAEGVVRSTAVVPWTIVRISETYGPGDGRLIKLFRAVNDGVVPIIGDGGNEHHPVYVDDLVAGLVLAAESPGAVGETIVLAGSEVVTTRGMIEAVAEALGKPLRSVRLPLTPLLLAAVVCETGCRPLGVSPPWHRRRLDFFVKRFAFSQDKAQRLLGYRPSVPFRQGARETADWYRRNGDL
ncbi:MAG: NAD(P)-dependent oxidoreductase [Gammaproteobacteria bacterium]|nr:NAD(P)-dependent oxidoreductase [Gammaproteobacteria bacterium]